MLFFAIYDEPELLCMVHDALQLGGDHSRKAMV